MNIQKIISKSLILKISAAFLASIVIFGSCERFFDPDQDLVVKEEDYFKDWYEYRAAEMGLYGLMQDLTEQLLILGELRADLLEITPNAGRDLIEVYNFNMSEQNKYSSPRNFYKLIAACNSLQLKLEKNRPDVLDKESPITNYDRLYGEVLIMRAWAYFNAVRIYKKIPYLPVTVTTIDDVITYVNSPKSFIDTLHIDYNIDGRYNDTLTNPDGSLKDTLRSFENAYLELPEIVDSCAKSILEGIKVSSDGEYATGVNHYIDNDDESWEATVWNEFAMYYLLGQMYLFKQDLWQADYYFKKITYYEEPEATHIKYGLDNLFAHAAWKNIFTSINVNEHIFVIWFGKSHRQTNNFQKLFSSVPPNSYELKPTRQAVDYWENIWDAFNYKHRQTALSDYSLQEFIPGRVGEPGDYSRGNLVSYAYRKGLHLMSNAEHQKVMSLKRRKNFFEIEKIANGYDTVVYKYTLGKESDPFSRDANFIVARAASVHLYAAEIYTYYAWVPQGPIWVPNLPTAAQYLNNGKYRGNADQLGVRGRVGFSDGDEAISTDQVIWLHDPHNHDIIDYIDFAGNSVGKAEYFEEEILKERARELAFEGERFYDLIRIAKKREDPTFLADMVASKFPLSKREGIRAHLMNENNWYLPFYLGTDE